MPESRFAGAAVTLGDHIYLVGGFVLGGTHALLRYHPPTNTWDKLAEMAAEHIVKGQLLLVEGRATPQAWTTEDNELRLSLKLTAQRIRLLGGKPEVEEG